MAADDETLTTSEAAAILGVSRKTVWRISHADLPFALTPGGGQRQQRRYRRLDVERYRLAAEPTDPALAERVQALEHDVADLKAWRSRLEMGRDTPEA